MTDQSSTKDRVVIHAVGDVGPRRIEYGEAPESLFAMAHQKIKEADISFCQVERNFSTKGCLQHRAHPTWHSRVHPENVKSLVFAGFSVASSASNHAFDYGPESLLESIDVLRSHNIQVIGAGKDIGEARKPAIVEKKGIKVGFLGYCTVLPFEYEAREEKPGCAPIGVSTYYEAQEYQAGTPPKIITIPLEHDVLAMEDDIRKLRKEVDVVVVSMHWGVHFVPGVLAMYQPVVGHRAIDAGADLIIGHHAHLIKGIEIYKGRAIFYSLGNFAEETPHHLKPPPGAVGGRVSTMYRKWRDQPGSERYSGPPDKAYTMMAKCIVSEKTIQRVSFLPGWINDRAEPELLSRNDPRFKEVLDYIEPWCEELGTTLAVEGDEVAVYSPTKK